MKISSEKQAAFCAALAETRLVGKACRAIDISRRTAYQWRQETPGFAHLWDKALGRPVFHGGQEAGAIRTYSDALTMFLLKIHSPRKYRDRANGVTPPGRV